MYKFDIDILADLNFSKALQNLLRKKIYSKSSSFHKSQITDDNLVESVPLVKVSKRKIVLNYLLYSLVLIMYFINIFRSPPRNKARSVILIFSLTKDQAIRNKSLKSLNIFLDSKGITNDSQSQVLIETRTFLFNRRHNLTKATFDIPFRIYASDFSFSKKVKCWVSMCKRFKKIMKLQRTHGFFSLILKEFIFDEIVYIACNSNYFEKLITTQSHIAYQPLIFEYDNILSKKLMIWYSANSNPLEYKKDTERFGINPTVYKNIRVDEHWVWTNENKKFLSTLTQAKILVKKSLMFYEADGKSIFGQELDVLIFDTTPFADANVTKGSIYTAKEIVKFIDEILLITEDLRKKYGVHHRVYLKNKRKQSRYHSMEYRSYLREKVKSKEITLVPYNVNLYDLIKECKLVIGYPFTSPIIIGKELNKPSVFYCSSKLLKRVPKKDNVLFIQNRTSLYNYMEKSLRVTQ